MYLLPRSTSFRETVLRIDTWLLTDFSDGTGEPRMETDNGTGDTGSSARSLLFCFADGGGESGAGADTTFGLVLPLPILSCCF